MAQLKFALFVEVALLNFALTQCNVLVDTASNEAWGSWINSDWTDEQWNPVVGVECKGSRCSSLRLLTYNAGIIQGSPQESDSYDTDVFSDPSNWNKLPTEVECKAGHIVTRVWCDGWYCSNLKLRCTKLQHLDWCTTTTCVARYTYWADTLSDENNAVDSSTRRCREGSVVVGMKCLDNYFCDRKRLRCRGIAPPSRSVSTWWEPYQPEGSTNAGTSSVIYAVSQTSELVSKHIFADKEAWSINGRGETIGTFQGHILPESSWADQLRGGLAPISRDFAMTEEHLQETFQEMKDGYSNCHDSTCGDTQVCEPKCHEEGKDGFLWVNRVDLLDKTITSADPQLGFFQTSPECLVRCVSKGMIPICPPQYCEDDNCQSCSSGISDALIGDEVQDLIGVGNGNFLSEAMHQHYSRQTYFLPILLCALVGMWQRSF